MTMFFRHAEVTDASQIDRLASAKTSLLFSATNAVNVIEKSVFSITAVNEAGNVVGNACFYDYPNVQSVKPSEWELWAKAHLVDPVAPSNTLFLRFAVVDTDSANADEFIPLALKTMFSALPEVEFLLLPTRPNEGENALEINGMRKYFSLADTNETEEPSAMELWLCRSAEILGQPTIRPAVAEDFDDLTPIFEKETEEIEQRFGKFFLYKLIESASETKKSLVYDIDGTAKGFINVTTDVDIDLLTNTYDLSAYNNLCDASGNPVAASISLFAMDDEYETMAVRLLPHVFEAFPSLLYLIISAPSTVTEFPLLQYFTHAIPLPEEDPAHELYVLHKYALSLDVAVRPIKDEDLDDAERLVSALPDGDAITGDINRVLTIGADPDGKRVFGHVIECHGAVAGVVVTREGKYEALPLRAQYNIEEFILFSQYKAREFLSLHHFVLHPLFLRHSKFVLREVLRKLGRAVMFYRIYGHDAAKEVQALAAQKTHDRQRLGGSATQKQVAARKQEAVDSRTVKDGSDIVLPSNAPILDALHAVKPRVQSMYCEENLLGNIPSQRVRDVGPAFSLLMSARKLLLEHKVVVNSRIVVTEPSSVALACLEDLCFRSHITFNNIIVISPTGSIPSRQQLSDDPAKRFLAADSLYDTSRLNKLALEANITIVRGSVVSITRNEKIVALADGDTIHYDFLLYLPDIKHTGCLDPLQEDVPPYGVLAPNSEDDIAEACEQAVALDDGNIIVYGSSTDAYSSACALLDLGIPAGRLVFVKGTVDETNNDIKGKLPHADVERFSTRALLDAGVTVHDACLLTGYDVDQQSMCLKGATFRSAETEDAEEFYAPASLLFNFHKRVVLREDFLPINAAFIVFDGGIRIDNTFRTNDPSILSAGAMTKYTRRLRVAHRHQIIESTEQCGKALSTALCRDIDPLEHSKVPGELELPPMKGPRVCISRLPGGLQLAHAQSPEGTLSRDMIGSGLNAEAFQSNTTELVTGSFELYYGESEEEEEEEEGKEVEEDMREDSGPNASAQNTSSDLDDLDGAEADVDLVDEEERVAEKYFGEVRFFAIHVDEFGIISSVTCLCKASTDVTHFLRLVGLHEKHVNNLVSRYNEGLIDDFYRFFQEPWAVALFHDRFQAFTASMSELVRDIPHSDHAELEAIVSSLTKMSLERISSTDDLRVDELKEAEDAEVKRLRDAVNVLDTQKTVKDRLMDYLAFNSYHLPMYARPNMW